MNVGALGSVIERRTYRYFRAPISARATAKGVPGNLDKNQGGIAAIEKINNAKAALLYTEIDRNAYFKGTANTEDRSVMNATFLLNDQNHAATFDAMWAAAGISGITGHRSVGGYRASMYNALPLESVQALVAVMQDFERKMNAGS